MAGLKLGYWNIRGLCQPIRYALQYCGEPYEEKLYHMGPAPTFDRSGWLADRTSIGLDFPNLPYLLEGDVKITEAVAILKYVCRKHNLMPKTVKDTARADNAEGVLLVLRTEFYAQFFGPGFEEKKKQFSKHTFPETMKNFVNFIGDRMWLISDEITYLDFLFYETMAQATCMYPECLEPFPSLQKYVTQFEALPSIQKYLTSGNFQKYPVTAPVALWGYTEE